MDDYLKPPWERINEFLLTIESGRRAELFWPTLMAAMEAMVPFDVCGVLGVADADGLRGFLLILRIPFDASQAVLAAPAKLGDECIPDHGTVHHTHVMRAWFKQKTANRKQLAGNVRLSARRNLSHQERLVVKHSRRVPLRFEPAANAASLWDCYGRKTF